ncbi:Uncharacterised protein [Neisseria gonorrhoeae]|nr:Uncharacterised protein [Neisseria gonorrhoeae]CNR92199.1 Uncharacterised protein [Neisseria gonorrhoeae]CNS77008.1 Uncharacterised protein [Neisseria gonorrhoeae]CNT04660.1 Uncharacterised protein [Neisseria gonorrhoeae]
MGVHVADLVRFSYQISEFYHKLDKVYLLLPVLLPEPLLHLFENLHNAFDDYNVLSVLVWLDNHYEPKLLPFPPDYP